MIVIMIDVVLCCMFVIWKRLKTPCVLWWCHSHPAILTAANLFNDFYPRSRRPIFVGNSDGHGRWIQTFDATEFATRMEELIFFLRFQLDAAYGPRHLLWTMRELNYCKLGVASLAETFFGVLCFLGGLCGYTLLYSESSPENDPYDAKREAVFQEISQRFCAFRAPFSSIFHFSVSDLPWLWEGPGTTLIMFDPSVQSWGESWKNEQKMKPLTPSDEISRRNSWVLRCLVVSSPRMGAFL